MLPVEHQQLDSTLLTRQATDYAHLIHAQDVFCCLGTTIKKAGSREAFSRVDFTTLTSRAYCGGEWSGAELLVSALGADAKSRVFYNRVKGEQKRRSVSFRSRRADFRPSLLVGERQESGAASRSPSGMKLFTSLLLVRSKVSAD